ncbi:MAG: 4-alpha-glucanotransferase, partial [Candidatus Cybelea sp.]
MIEPYYDDYWGNRVATPESTRRALLAAMGSDESVANDAQSLPPVIVVRHGEEPRLPHGVRSSLDLEDGSGFSGNLSAAPLGYHQLTLRRGSREERCALIVVPAQCYLPPRMRDGRVWAVSTQLYALRSRRNWGIGDFTDLAAFAELAARSGARTLGVNPLHELHPNNPQAASPYSPSSRLFLNVLYIDVENVAELAESPETQAATASPAFSRRLAALRRSELVDYRGVATAKLEMLERLHRVFYANHWTRPNDPRARAFRRFVCEGGLALERLAVYEALAEFFRGRDASAYGWHDWRSEYRSPDSPSVTRFAAEHRDRVDFYLYLQFLAARQLAEAARTSQRHGASLYCDLAVGVERNGADAWAGQDVILSNASLGAPPDPLNLKGQNWGLAPLSPRALRERAYEPFVALLRANMRYAGILRVDHVMALRRAFLIPRGAPASEGAYVGYDLDAMLGILALESVRNRCVVVGEDLGTIPEGFRERIQDARALSSRVFYFERDGSGAFLPPSAYPRLAAASAGTHDLPTLAGWWTGDRIEHEDRARDRLRLVDALQ